MVEQKLNKRCEFYFGSLRLKLEGKLGNISIVLVFLHSGPDTELRVGQFPAVFLGQSLIDL